MAYTPKIVVAGYGGWALASDNPAQRVIERLQNPWVPGCDIVPLKISVDTEALASLVSDALDEHRPDAWIGVGVAPGAVAIRAEMVGVNWRHFSVPDAMGVTAELQPIIQDGPDAYNADLPNKAITEAMCAAHIPALLSFTAGTHLCNQMLYTVRHLICTRKLGTISGFIHVPQSIENVARAMPEQAPGASMSVDVMADAVAIAIEQTISRCADRRRSK